jgi:hypothetical protein
MAWLLCLICAAAGAFLAIFLGDWLTSVYRMSDMEGGRGYFIMLVLAPLGFLGGLVIGIVAVWRSDVSGFAGYARLLRLVLLLIVAVSAAIALVAYLLADHGPRINGRSLLLQYELRLPKTAGSLEQLRSSRLVAALGGSHSSPSAADLHLKQARLDPDGAIVVPAEVDLPTHSSTRFLYGNFPRADGSSQEYQFTLALPASPTVADEAWSSWLTEPADLGEPSGQEHPALRYRVQTAP